MAGCDQFHRLRAIHGAECPVEGRRTASALEMPEHAGAGLLSGAFLHFGRDYGADAAQTGFTIGLLSGGGDEAAVLLPRTFGDDHDGEMFARGFAFLDLCAHPLVRERYLRDEDHIRTARDARVDGDPA